MASRMQNFSSYDSACASEAGSTSEAGFMSEASTSEAGSTSEASASEDQIPTSTSEFPECGLPEYDEDSVEEATNRVRRKLIETGRMDGLKYMMERRLSEIGWRIEMMKKCREKVREKGASTSFEMLFQNIRKFGKEKVPETVKEDMIRRIQYCYEAKAIEE